MIHVHYLEDSRAQRVLWLLEELDQPYDLKIYRRGPDMLAPKELRDVHPLGKSPVIEEDGVVTAESGPITEILINRHGAGSGLRPEPGTPEADAYLYWMHYAEGSGMPLLVQKLVFGKLPERVPALLRPLARAIMRGVETGYVDPQIRDHLAFWEQTLSEHDYFAGPEFTAADIQMSFPVEAALERTMPGGASPALARWLAAIRARPAYLRALEKGAYRFGKAEA